MNKSEEAKPVIKVKGKAPNAFYYLGRFMEDSLLIDAQHFKDRKDKDACIKQLTVQYFGSLEEDGLLQEDMNQYYNGILEDLKRDYPRFTRRRILVFSYTAARLPMRLICQLADISSEGSVSTMRWKMKAAIACHACPRKAQYLELLGR